MNKYIVILNFDVMKIEVFDITSFDWNDYEIEEKMYDIYQYSLSNCQWMITNTPIMHPVNF